MHHLHRCTSTPNLLHFVFAQVSVKTSQHLEHFSSTFSLVCSPVNTAASARQSQTLVFQFQPDMETIKGYLYQRFHSLLHVAPAPHNREQLRGGQKSDSSGKKKLSKLSEADKSEILGGRASDCSYLADSSPLGNVLN